MMIVKYNNSIIYSKKTLLVEEVVVHFNLRIGLEIIWHEHDGNLNMA